VDRHWDEGRVSPRGQSALAVQPWVSLLTSPAVNRTFRAGGASQPVMTENVLTWGPPEGRAWGGLCGVRADEAEFDAFYREAYPRLAGYAFTLFGDRNAAHDAAQEALSRLWARWDAVREPRAYAYLTVTNLAKGEWRARPARLRALRLWHVGQPDLLPAPDGSVRDALRRLPTRLREVAVLHYISDMSLEQVAMALGRPLGTVKRQASEARTALAQALGEEG
jgi:RNA polymerase sigma-70 factor (ECF subfamily)